MIAPLAIALPLAAVSFLTLSRSGWMRRRWALAGRLARRVSDAALRRALLDAAGRGRISVGGRSFVAARYGVEAWGPRHEPLTPLQADLELELGRWLEASFAARRWRPRGRVEVRVRILAGKPRDGTCVSILASQNEGEGCDDRHCASQDR